MHTTFTIKQSQLRAIVAKAIGCHESQVNLTDDTDGDGFDATIITDDPGAPMRAKKMFDRWEKAAASDRKAN